jgi:hypothetical protein
MSKSRARKVKPVPLPWISVTYHTVDIFDCYDWSHYLLIGWGLVYFDGQNLLKPDFVDLLGEPLPGGTFYNVALTGEPVLAVLAMSVQ